VPASEDDIFNYMFLRKYGRWTSRAGPTRHHIRQLEAYRVEVIRKRAATISARVAKANSIASLKTPIVIAIAILSFFVVLILAS
jgi:hypothetical protein